MTSNRRSPRAVGQRRASGKRLASTLDGPENSIQASKRQRPKRTLLVRKKNPRADQSASGSSAKNVAIGARTGMSNGSGRASAGIKKKRQDKKRINVHPITDKSARAKSNGRNQEIIQTAQENPKVKPNEASSFDSYWAYMPTHQYIFIPTGALWPASSINSRLRKKGRLKANKWLDRNQHIEQMTWVPGEPQFIRDRIISHGGWKEAKGCTCFNLYRPPTVIPGDAEKAGPWRDHIRRIYPDDANHIEKILAHRVQRPGEKLNHALLLGGEEGIGKDTFLEPVKHAVGHANFQEVSPEALLGRFTPFAKSVILRISEARDLGDIDRVAFYDHLKVYTAAPPDVLRVDEKNLREYYVPNVCGVIITTNYKLDGIYLPTDDRRHYVAWSGAHKEEFEPSYFPKLYHWFDNGGIGHVTAFLQSYDLSGFDAKAPPPKTPAFWDIVRSNCAPEDAEMADVLDAIGKPKAITIAQLAAVSTGDFRGYLTDRRNSRVIPTRLEKAGYVRVHSDTAKDGLWFVREKRQAIYARAELSPRDRMWAAQDLCVRC